MFFVILEVIVIAAVAMFFSSLVVTTTLTGLFTLGCYVAGRSIGYLNYFLDESKNPNVGLQAVVSVFDKILPDLSTFNVNDSIVYGIPVAPEHFVAAITYCVSYSAVALVLAAIIFERRELT